MPDGQLPTILGHVRGLVAARQEREATDRELLDRFVGSCDEAAFAALLQRHGAMVLAVCRRVLRDPQDAEDACQATFLVLARKAPSIRKRDALGSWLYGVAARVARNLRRGAARRRGLARPAADVPQPDAAAALSWREVQEALDEELLRLPESLRAPLVLCCLEGMSRDEAAQQLGVSPGTLKGRLERGRQRLRGRLTRRGVSLSAAWFAATVGPEAPAAVPAAPAVATVHAAVRLRSGGAAAGTVSPRVAALVEALTGGMCRRTFSLGAAAIVGLSLLAVHHATVPEGSAGQGHHARLPGGDKQVRTDPEGEPLPAGAIARLGSLRFRHGQHIESIAFSPDGQTIASAGADGRVVLHDRSTGKKVRSFQGDGPGASAVAFAPDGKTLAAGSPQVNVWQLATGKRVRQFQAGQGGITYLAYSLDGRTLVGGSHDHLVYAWDVRTGKEVGRIAPPRHFQALTLSRDGKTLATASYNEQTSSLCLWETTGGRKLRQWQAHRGEVAALAFSPDGKRLASASTEGEDRLCVWHVPKGERQLDLPGAFTCLRFSPGGKVLAAATHESVSLLEADTGKEIRRIPRGTPQTPGSPRMCFSPDGETLALADQWTITLWKVSTGKKLRPLSNGHDHLVDSVTFLRDGKTIASASRDAVYFWQVPAGRRIGRFEGVRVSQGLLSLWGALSPDGKTLALSTPGENQTIELWDTATGKKVRELEARQKYSRYLLVFSPDGKSLAAARAGDGTIWFWDVAAGKLLRRFAAPTALVQSLAFSPDGKTLAVGDADLDSRRRPRVPTVRLLDAVTGRELRKPFELPAAPGQARHRGFMHVGQVAFSADGKVLAAATSGFGYFDRDHTIQVRDVKTGKVLCRLEQVSDRFALSPDGKSLVTMGSPPRLWEVTTGKVRARIRGHSNTVWTASFSPDGRLLATGGQDTTVLVWDVLNLPGVRLEKQTRRRVVGGD
jgi:RNA polymerase sigma factor (sigma-70 family)